LLGDLAAPDFGVGLAMPGREPRPGGELFGTREAGDVTDLSDEHRGQDRPDARDRLNGPIAPVAAQLPGDHLIERGGAGHRHEVPMHPNMTRTTGRQYAACG
jgi:hypothetical protein